MSKNYIVFDSMMVPPQKNIFLLLYCIIFDNKFLLILRNSKLLSINFLCVTLSHMSIAMGDIDFFKHVNDTYGHDAGDEVLRTLSRLFCTVIGEKGEVCRWGGEEFLFVFPGMDMEEVQLLMSDLLDDIRHTPVLYERKLIHVTMTFGVEEFGRNHTMESVIQEADRKLYLGKESGRNRVIY